MIHLEIQGLVGKEIKSIETKDTDVTYCYHVNSPEYKNGKTSEKTREPKSILIKFKDGTELEIGYRVLGVAYKEEGAIHLTAYAWDPNE